jgi:putative PIN family toxin of toxin-antitoxin system
VDTNVIVSAVLSPSGNSAKILNMIFDREIQLCCSTEILAEYVEVLSRPRLNIAIQIQRDIVNAITEAAVFIKATAGEISMPDEDDRIFYNAARESAAILITGNIKHYPTEAFVMAPVEFVTMIES